MKYEELIYEMVLDRLPPQPPPELLPYINGLLFGPGAKGLEAEDVRRIYSELRKTAALEPKETILEIPTTSPRLRIMTTQICDAWQDKIEAIREDLLGSRKPLTTEKKLEKWIENEEQLNLQELRKGLGGTAVTEAVRDLQKETGYTISWDIETLHYPVMIEGRANEIRILLAHGTRLYAAAAIIRSIARRTGFDEGSVFQWVLTDIRPKPDPIEAWVTRLQPFPQDREVLGVVENWAMVSDSAKEFQWVRKFIEQVKRGKKKRALSILKKNEASLDKESAGLFRQYAEDPPFYREINHVTIKFRSKPTWRELYEDAYRSIRDYLEAVPPLHLKIWELVQEYGEPETEWNKDYWDRKIRHQLIAHGFIEARKMTFQGIAKAYRSLKRKSKNKEGRK